MQSIPLTALLILTTAASAATLHVPSEYSSIAGAILAASSGDTVLVADGTYVEYRIGFHGKAIKLRSENGPSQCKIFGTGNYPTFYLTEGETTNTVIQGFTIIGNTAGEPATGISMFNSSPTIINNVIRGGIGCGIDCYNSSPLIINNVIVENGHVLGSNGGGIYCQGPAAQPVIVNNTIAFNSGWVGGITAAGDAAPKIYNCIVWGNDNGLGELAPLIGCIASFSCFEGAAPSDGNISTDPRFVLVDPGAHYENVGVGGDYSSAVWVSSSDFRLHSTSLCIDAGSNNALPSDNADLDQDGNVQESVPFDVSGKPRINSSVDIGAFENPRRRNPRRP